MTIHSIAGSAITIVLTFALSESTTAQMIEWPVSAGGNGHLYGLTSSTGTWTQANTEATTAGGYLASVTSAAEQMFLQGAFFCGSDERVPYWIGLTDVSQEGIFAWSSGEALGFTNWAPGEPNDAMGPVSAGVGEDFAAINWGFANFVGGHAQGAWNDCPDGGTTDGNTAFQPYRGIVEVGAIPEPSSASLAASVGVCLLTIQRQRRRTILCS